MSEKKPITFLELRTKIDAALQRNPELASRPVLAWRGKRKSDSVDSFWDVKEIIAATINVELSDQPCKPNSILRDVIILAPEDRW